MFQRFDYSCDITSQFSYGNALNYGFRSPYLAKREFTDYMGRKATLLWTLWQGKMNHLLRWMSTPQFLAQFIYHSTTICFVISLHIYYEILVSSNNVVEINLNQCCQIAIGDCMISRFCDPTRGNHPGPHWFVFCCGNGVGSLELCRMWNRIILHPRREMLYDYLK